MTLSVPKAAAWVGMVLAAIALALLLSSGGSKPYVVYARFTDADGLLPNFFVKIDQIQAGVVQSVTLAPNTDEVIVKMGLNHSTAPIGAGASAQVRPANLLGEKYVQLNPGDLSKPLPSGSTIPLARTGAPVELDDIFNTLDRNTLTGVSLIVNEAGLAMAGRGSDFMQTLRDLPPTLGAARQVVGEVASENASLEQAITAGNRVLTSIDSRRGDLQSLVQSGNDALGAISDARVNLGRTIADAPGGLGQLRTSLRELQGAADALTPAAADLQATAPALGSTLERLPAFTGDAVGALREARDVSPSLVRLATQSTPILRQLRPATGTLATFAQDAGPALDMLDQQGGLKEFLGFVAGWTGVTSQKDALGHVFRLRFSLDPQLVTSALGKYEALFGKHHAAHRHSHRVTARPTALAPVERKAPATARQLVGGLNGSVSQLAKVLSGALGATNSTVTSVVKQATGAVLPPSDSASPSQDANATRLLKFLLGS